MNTSITSVKPGQIWTNRFASDHRPDGTPRRITILDVPGPHEANGFVTVNSNGRRNRMRMSTLISTYTRVCE